MSDTKGVLLRGEDGQKYFIPHDDLNSRYAVKHESVKQENVHVHAPHVEAWQAKRQGEGDDAVHVAMLNE
jgi:hypothetical protein